MVSTGQIEGGLEPFSETEPRWCCPNDHGSPPGPSVFSFGRSSRFSQAGASPGGGAVTQPRALLPPTLTPRPGLQALGSKGNEGDRGRWASGEKAEESQRESRASGALCPPPRRLRTLPGAPSPAKGRGPVPLHPSLGLRAWGPAEQTPLGLAGRRAPSGGGKEAGGAGPGPRLGQNQLGRRGARGIPGPRWPALLPPRLSARAAFPPARRERR